MTNAVLDPPRPRLRNAVEFLAILTTGLSAGLFYAYAISFMPGLARADDQTFVNAMRETNAAILTGWLYIPFVGCLFLLALATVFEWRLDRRRGFWLLAALVLYAAAFFVTVGINVPLNDELAAATGQLSVIRADFESTWVAWHTVRTVAGTGALACLAWAAVRRSG